MPCSLILLFVVSAGLCSWYILFPFLFCDFDHDFICPIDGTSLRPVLKMGTSRAGLHLFLLGTQELYMKVYFNFNAWLEVFWTPRYSVNWDCKPVCVPAMLQILRWYISLLPPFRVSFQGRQFSLQFSGVGEDGRFICSSSLHKGVVFWGPSFKQRQRGPHSHLSLWTQLDHCIHSFDKCPQGKSLSRFLFMSWIPPCI